MSETKSFHEILREIEQENENIKAPPIEDTLDFQLPVVEGDASEIILHRDAHFSGNFDIMIKYYQECGRGSSREFEISEIEALAELEKYAKQNIAPLVLSGSDMESIGRARNTLKKLKELYEVAESQKSHAVLIADLILAETEDLDDAINAVVNEGKKIIPALLSLLQSDNFYDPLFPGYGQAPALAAQCLGKIGDPSTIGDIFRTLNFVDDFLAEEQIISALQKMEKPAKDFLLKVLKSRPITSDNELAAVVLSNFNEDPEIYEECSKQLKDPEILEHPILQSYLSLGRIVN